MRDPEEKPRFEVRFADETKREFRKIGPSGSADILAAVQKKLTTRPDEYGEPLGRDLAGFRKLPVGQWRVVYAIEQTRVLVLVLVVGKRAEGDHENIYGQLTRKDLDARRAALRRRVGGNEE